ncbi:MAG: hypothetical protein WB624_18375, partial [Xanthobacteraceae bacterium]
MAASDTAPKYRSFEEGGPGGRFRRARVCGDRRRRQGLHAAAARLPAGKGRLKPGIAAVRRDGTARTGAGPR